MSTQALTWLRTVRVPMPQKVVLYCLADHADERGVAWPAVETIAARTGASERTVQNALKALTKAKLIRVDRSFRHARRTPTYFLQIGTGSEHTLCTEGGVQDVRGAGAAPRRSCTPPPQELHPHPAGAAPKSPSKHHGSGVVDSTRVDRPSDLFGRQAPGGTTKRRSRYDRPEHPDFAEWWSAYPKKVSRRDAVVAYAEAIERGASPGELLIGVRNFTFPSDSTYVPHPATWLNKERWKDAPLSPRPADRRYSGAGSDASRLGVLDAFPELVGEAEAGNSTGRAGPPRGAGFTDPDGRRRAIYAALAGELEAERHVDGGADGEDVPGDVSASRTSAGDHQS